MKIKKLYILIFFLFTCLLSTNAQTFKIIKTPEERFKSLIDYNFTPNYMLVDNNLEMHYIDVGDKSNPIILLLHGEPAWSYIYRNMIPILVQNGYRVIAPDLIGFGKSDKIIGFEQYTYTNHTKWVNHFIEKLELNNIKLYAHDWGGMIGLRIVAQQPHLFSHIIISDAFLFTGKEITPKSFKNWVKFAKNDVSFNAGTVMNWATNVNLSQETIKAYNAPYPNEEYMYGLRIFPSLIPTEESDKEAKINLTLMDKLKILETPFLTIWGDNKDAMWLGKDKILQLEINGAKNVNHQTIHANHFLQEDNPELLTEIILNFIKK